MSFLENKPVASGIFKKKKKKSKESVGLCKPSLESTSVNYKKNHFPTGMKHIKDNLVNHDKNKQKIIKEKEKTKSIDQYTNSDIEFKNSANLSPHNGTDYVNEFYVRTLKNKIKSSEFTNPATNVDNSVREECSRRRKKRKSCDSDNFHVAKKTKQENSFENVVKTNVKVEQSNSTFVLEETQDNELFFFDIAGNTGNSFVQFPILDKINIETTTPGISNTNVNIKKKKELRKKKHKISAEEESNSATLSSSFKTKLKKKHKHRETLVNKEEEVMNLSDSGYKTKKKKRNKTLEATNHQGSCSKTNSFIDFSEDGSLLDRLIENFSQDLSDVKQTIEAGEKKRKTIKQEEKDDSETKGEKTREVMTFRETTPLQRKKKKTKIRHTENGTEAEEMHPKKAFDETLCENSKSELERSKDGDNSGSNNSSTKENSQLSDNCEVVGVSDPFVPKKKKKKKKHLRTETDNSVLKKEHSVSSENSVLLDMSHEITNPESNSKSERVHDIKDSEPEVSNVDDSSLFKKRKKRKAMKLEHKTSETSTPQGEQSTLSHSCSLLDTLLEQWSNGSDVIDIDEKSSSLKKQNSELPKGVDDRDCNASDSLSKKKKKKKKWKDDNYLTDNEGTLKKEDAILESSVDNLGRSRDENDEQNDKLCLGVGDGDGNTESASNFAFSKSKKKQRKLGPNTSAQDISGCLYTPSPKNNNETGVINNALGKTSEKAVKSTHRSTDSESDLSSKKKKRRKNKTHQLDTSTGLNCNNSLIDTDGDAVIEKNGLNNVKKSKSVLLKYDSESTMSRNSYYREVYASSSEGYKSDSSEIISPLKTLKKKRHGDSVKIFKSDCNNTSEPFASITSKNENSSQLEGVSQKTEPNNGAASTEGKDTIFKKKGRKAIEKASRAHLVKLERDVKVECDDESSIDALKEHAGDIENFLQIDIVLQFPIPPLHSILTRSTLPTEEQLKEIKNQKIEVKSGPFTNKEDQKILANWKEFCKEYDLRMVPSMFVTMPRTLPVVQKNNFLRYLARGLDNRFLHRVHARFKILVQKNIKKSGRFTPEEDETILWHLNESSSNFPYRDLSELLDRSRLSIEKRYARLSAENKNTIHWTPELVDKLVKYMKRLTNCEDVEGLKHKQLTAKEWKQLSKKLMNIPVTKLQRAWNCTVYPRLFADDDVDLKQMKVRIIEMLDDMNETDWRKIKWRKIAEEFPGFTHLKIYMMFKQLVSFHVPKEKQANLKECVKFLRDKMVDNGVVPTTHHFKRIVYEDGHIIW